MKISVCIGIVILASFGFLTGAAIGQPPGGSLDPDFGSGGVVVSNIPGSSTASVRKIAVHSDGRIVALVEDYDSTNSYKAVLAAFLANGALDSSFGTGGFVYLSWPVAPGASPKNVVVQPDGRLIVSGFAPFGRNASAMRFERYNSDGSVDSTFGSGGAVSVNITGGNGLTLQPDGKILAMGADGALVRLNPNGSADLSFGSNGIASPRLSLTPWFNGLRVLPSGKIVATGRIVTGGIGYLAVGGYNANGSLDDGGKGDSTPGNQFGSKGRIIVDFTGHAGGRGLDIEIDSLGRIVVLGAAGNQNTALALVRMSGAGQLDATFGSSGKVVLTDPNGSPQGTSLDIQSDGRLLVLGGLYMGPAPDGTAVRDAMMVRFTTSGSLDSFDVGQMVLTDTFGADEVGYDGILRIDPVCQCEHVLWAGASYAGPAPYTSTPLLIQYVP